MNIDAIEAGLEVWANIGGKKIAGKILEWAFSSEGDYLQCKVELEIDNPLAPGQVLKQIYPKPIQSYKLSYRGEHPIRPRRNHKREQEENLKKLAEVAKLLAR